MKLIKNWKELSRVPSNDKYKIIVDLKYCSGWIVPLCDEFDEIDNFLECMEEDTVQVIGNIAMGR